MTRSALIAVAGLLMAAPSPQGDGILRLKPADFRQLPVAVRRDLEKRGCRIPQVSWKAGPHNVIAGSFTGKDSRDWAVLCSIRGESRVLVYRNGRTARVDSLARARDESTHEVNGIFGSRKIDIAEPKRIMDQAKAYGGPKPPSPLDHHGVDDGGERGSVIWYLHRGKWLELVGSN